MSKYHTVIFKTDTLTLTKSSLEKGDNRGYWLWDETREMNLAIRADTEREAFIEALEYYQERLKTVEAEYKALNTKVEAFVSQFVEDNDNDDNRY